MIFLLAVLLVKDAAADLRFASQPHASYQLRNEAGAVPFVTQNIFYKYMIPSSFGYKKLGPLGRPEQTFGGPGGGRGRGRGRALIEVDENSSFTDDEDEPVMLEQPRGRGRGRPGGPGGFQMPPRGQKYRNYDNFLRSNIDNEQDNRDFTNDPGRDHLPFRTNESEIYSFFNTDKFDHRKMAKVGPIDLRMTIKPGNSVMIPIRWNNPHAAELEVNIWVFPPKSHPVVVPIRKPTCSAEGHQDNIFSFTIPKDFVELGAKVPGFNGCSVDTKPMCVLQVYANSVESRQYAYGFPLIVPGHKPLTTTSTKLIQPIAKDPVLDLNVLRDLCMSSADPSANIATAVPRWARLVSDLYTHAYLNSDYSPYSGQQHEGISKNMQASAINKMWSGNRGELGASILPSETKTRIAQLDSLEGRTYKRYESMANRLIRKLERAGQLTTFGTVTAMGTTQRLAKCFRCQEVGSTIAKRLTTNTYIPSFQLPPNLVAPAKRSIFRPYRSLINHKGQVQIYIAALRDLLPFFHASQTMGIIYQGAMLRTTMFATFPSAVQHKKRDQNGAEDGGVYASKLAKKALAESFGCPFPCLWCKAGPKGTRAKPLINGATATCITGKCSKCTAFYGTAYSQSAKAPPLTENAKSIAKNGSPPDVDSKDKLTPYPEEEGSEVTTVAPAAKWDLPAALIDKGGNGVADRRRRRRSSQGGNLHAPWFTSLLQE